MPIRKYTQVISIWTDTEMTAARFFAGNADRAITQFGEDDVYYEVRGVGIKKFRTYAKKADLRSLKPGEITWHPRRSTCS